MPALSRRVLLRSLAATCGLGALATVPSAASGGAELPTTERADPAGPRGSTTGRRYEVTGLVVGADNTRLLNSAFDAAQPGDVLVLPQGDWTHGGVLQMANSDLALDAYGVRLIATDPRHAGLHITGSRVAVRGLTHEVLDARARGNGENLDDSPFSIDGGSDVVLEDVVSVGARDAGIFLYGAQRARLTNVQVRDSLADGVHLTAGCTSCVITSPTVLSPGDDGVAVVSYAQDSAVCSDIRIDNPLVVDGQARGVTVSGGSRVVITRVQVRRTRGSGVYLASESGQFDTAAVTDCRVSGGTLDDSNWDRDLDTGGVGIFALVSGSVTKNVIVEGLTVNGSQKSAGNYIKIGTSNGTGGRFDGLVLRDISIPGGQVYIDGAAPTVLRDGSSTLASVAAGALTAAGTVIRSGVAAVGGGVTVARIRR